MSEKICANCKHWDTWGSTHEYENVARKEAVKSLSKKYTEMYACKKLIKILDVVPDDYRIPFGTLGEKEVEIETPAGFGCVYFEHWEE